MQIVVFPRRAALCPSLKQPSPAKEVGYVSMGVFK